MVVHLLPGSCIGKAPCQILRCSHFPPVKSGIATGRPLSASDCAESGINALADHIQDGQGRFVIAAILREHINLAGFLARMDQAPALVDGHGGNEIAVWLVLYRDTKQDGTARTSQADMARRVGTSDRTVRRALDKLERRGLLKVTYRGGIGRGPSAYRVRPLPPMDSGQSSVRL